MKYFSHTRQFKPIFKKLMAHCLVAGVLLTVAVPLVHASVTNEALSFSNPLKANSIEDLLADILKLVSRLGAIIAVLYFIYGGFLYVTAQGDEEKVGKAHGTLKWAAVGTAVLLSAEIIARIIENTVKSVSNI
ncbi:MAG: pilin [Patescibacteria group bacterium]